MTLKLSMTACLRLECRKPGTVQTLHVSRYYDEFRAWAHASAAQPGERILYRINVRDTVKPPIGYEVERDALGHRTGRFLPRVPIRARSCFPVPQGFVAERDGNNRATGRLILCN